MAFATLMRGARWRRGARGASQWPAWDRTLLSEHGGHRRESGLCFLSTEPRRGTPRHAAASRFKEFLRQGRVRGNMSANLRWTPNDSVYQVIRYEDEAHQHTGRGREGRLSPGPLSLSSCALVGAAHRPEPRDARVWDAPKMETQRLGLLGDTIEEGREVTVSPAAL